MTISTETRKAGPYAGNGVATSFAFAFKIFAKAELVVTHVSAAGVETAKVLDTDYSVTLNGDQDANPGGSITYPISGSPLPAGETLTIDCDVAETQSAALQNLGGYYPKVIEYALDRLTILVQQLRRLFGRALLQPLSDADVIGALPAKANRANKYLLFDAAGNPIASAGSGTDTGLRADLASLGASLIGVQDSAGRLTATTVENALAEINSWPIQPRGSNTILDPDDNGSVIRATASYTQTLMAAAALGNGWMAVVMVDAGFILTLDPNAAETINGLVTAKIAGGGAVILHCDGTQFFMHWLSNATDRVDVASAATVDLRRDVNGSNYARITGATTITAVTLRNGERIDTVFAGALTLTNTASLILPGGANITTAAGDVVTLLGETGAVRAVAYQPAAGGGGGLFFRGTAAPNVATFDVPLPTSSRHARVVIDDFSSGSNLEAPGIRFSTDGGVTFAAGASDYGWHLRYYNFGAAGISEASDATDSNIHFTGGQQAELPPSSLSADFVIYTHRSSTLRKMLLGEVFDLTSVVSVVTRFSGQYTGSSAALTHMRIFLYTGGLIDRITVSVYGL